jgi:uncharacterized protein
MIHPATEVRPVRKLMGLGVFATMNIRRGTVVWILDRFDRVVRPEELRAWPAVTRMIAERFGYIDAQGSWVVCWDHGRLMNHSCDPATVSVGDGLEIARRDIATGDEVTCDYGTLNLTSRLRCLCGAATCRREITAQRTAAMCATWDQWADEAFVAGLTVPQPLLPFARGDGTDAAILAALGRGQRTQLPPIRRVLCPPPERTTGAAVDVWAVEE